MQRSLLLSELRATVTGASVDYVGSVTVHEELCDALGLLDRQLVHIRNERTSVDLWTYVIRGLDCPDRCPLGTVCLNGAAAHVVRVGDVVSLTARGWMPGNRALEPRRWDAVRDGVTNVMSRLGRPSPTWAHEAVLEYACGKVHRPRITHLVNTNTTTTPSSDNSHHGSALPALVLDQDWAREGSILEGEAIHLVNVTNGQRDIVTARYAPAGSQHCAIYNIKSEVSSTTTSSISATATPNRRPGYHVGDVVIAMTYGSITRGAVVAGKAPPMRICFPFERPVYMTAPTTSSSSEEENSTTSNSSLEHDENVDLHALWDHSARQHQLQLQQQQQSHTVVSLDGGVAVAN